MRTAGSTENWEKSEETPGLCRYAWLQGSNNVLDPVLLFLFYLSRIEGGRHVSDGATKNVVEVAIQSSGDSSSRLVTA